MIIDVVTVTHEDLFTETAEIIGISLTVTYQSCSNRRKLINNICPTCSKSQNKKEDSKTSVVCSVLINKEDEYKEHRWRNFNGANITCKRRN